LISFSVKVYIDAQHYFRLKQLLHFIIVRRKFSLQYYVYWGMYDCETCMHAYVYTL